MVVDREAVRVGRWRTVHLTLYRGSPRIPDIQASAAAHDRLRATYPGKTAVLVYGEKGGGMPDSETRAYISELQKEVAPQTRCAATVLQAEGFWASAAYSVLVGVGLFIRPGCPTKFFKDLDVAANWVIEHLDDPDARPQDLAAAVEALRAAPAT